MKLDQRNMAKGIKCPNCGNMCQLNEYTKYCRKCGRIFVEYLDIMSDEKIKHKTTTRRTGKDVDQLDG